MSQEASTKRSSKRHGLLWFSLTATAVFLLLFVQVMLASSNQPITVSQDEDGETIIIGDSDGPTLADAIDSLPFVITEADLSGSSKEVDETEAIAGETVQYVVTIRNSGDQPADDVQFSDALPGSVSLVGNVTYDELNVWNDSWGVANEVITWTGSVGPSGYAEFVFNAVITETALLGEVISNTAVITGTGVTINRTAVTTIIESPDEYVMYMPLVFMPLPTPSLNVSTPNGQNQWTVFWQDVDPNVTRYVLQESNSSSFAQVTEYVIDSFTPGGQVSQLISHPPSANNVYYYRVQAQNAADAMAWSTWSNVGMVIAAAPVNLNLQATRPNANNQWTLSWQNPGVLVTSYQFQEATNSSFNNATTTNLNPNVYSRSVQKPISTQPVFYYRVRPVWGSYVGSWSNTVQVVGGYRDDFSDPTSGWVPQRRTTYLEQTNVLYGQNEEEGNLIIIVGDRWDWMLASPLVPAPQVPYNIEFRARNHDASNLISGGAVFGGDWNGDACPEIGNIYQTDNCFNHFYNYNMIFYGPIKLLHEQVNELFYCPNCDGSQIKRLGPQTVVDPIVNNDRGKDWHEYRIEVRENGATYYVNDSFAGYFPDTTWIHEPYFGVFASTDEYKPSIWFFDYYQVRPVN